MPQSTQVATSNCTCPACMRHASVTCVCLVRLARGPRGQAPKNVGNPKEAWTRKTMARLARAVVLDGVRGRMARKHHVSPSWHRSRPCEHVRPNSPQAAAARHQTSARVQGKIVFFLEVRHQLSPAAGDAQPRTAWKLQRNLRSSVLREDVMPRVWRRPFMASNCQ